MKFIASSASTAGLLSFSLLLSSLLISSSTAALCELSTDNASSGPIALPALNKLSVLEFAPVGVSYTTIDAGTFYQLSLFDACVYVVMCVDRRQPSSHKGFLLSLLWRYSMQCFCYAIVCLIDMYLLPIGYPLTRSSLRHFHINRRSSVRQDFGCQSYSFGLHGRRRRLGDCTRRQFV